jgi:hypothetical protein
MGEVVKRGVKFDKEVMVPSSFWIAHGLGKHVLPREGGEEGLVRRGTLGEGNEEGVGDDIRVRRTGDGRAGVLAQSQQLDGEERGLGISRGEPGTVLDGHEGDDVVGETKAFLPINA